MSAYIEQEAEKYGFEYIEMDKKTIWGYDGRGYEITGIERQMTITGPGTVKR
jgi:hypothetical protein